MFEEHKEGKEGKESLLECEFGGYSVCVCVGGDGEVFI